MSQYQIAIIECPAKHLSGMKVRTTMHKAKQDCTTLWQNFASRIGELLTDHSNWPPCYGVSVMLNAEDFDYWAVVETPASISVPAGMSNISLQPGQYAKCTVSELEKIDEGYTYLYEVWPNSQSEYTYDEQASCFELYPANWHPAQPFDIYMPLKKKV